MSQGAEHLLFDPFDVDMDEEKRFAIYERARDEQPFMLHEGLRRVWSVFRYEDIFHIVHDHKRFPSVPELKGSFVILFDDPPEHSRLRKVVDETFSRRNIERLRTNVATIAETLLRDAIDAGEIDFYTEVAEPLFIRIICEILGLPETDQDIFHHWSQEIIKVDKLNLFTDPDPRKKWDLVLQPLFREVGEFLSPLIEQRIQSPADDLLSILVENTRSGAMLSAEELYELAIMMVVGGEEAAPLLLANAMLLLDRYPEQQSLLWSEPDLVSSAVEEVLRFRPSFRNVERSVAADTNFQNVTLKTGDVLTCWLDSANRDERKFKRPEDFDIMRKFNPHLAFNRGTHMCLGNNLSRILAQETLKVLLRITQSFEVCGTPVPFPGPSLNGPQSLPVRLIPA